MAAEGDRLLWSDGWEDNNDGGYQMQLERLYNLKALLFDRFDANR